MTFLRVIGDLHVNQRFISDESHAFGPFRAKITSSFMLHFVLRLAYLIDSSKAIKVGGKQKPYEMWQAGISLAASPSRAPREIWRPHPLTHPASYAGYMEDRNTFNRLTCQQPGSTFAFESCRYIKLEKHKARSHS